MTIPATALFLQALFSLMESPLKSAGICYQLFLVSFFNVNSLNGDFIPFCSKCLQVPLYGWILKKNFNRIHFQCSIHFCFGTQKPGTVT